MVGGWARYSAQIAGGDRQGSRLSADGPDSWVIWRTGQTPRAASGREWQGAQSRQGGAELISPSQLLGEMHGEAAGLAGEASGQGEKASPEGLGGGHQLTQTDARCPADQVMGDDLDSQPGGIGGETTRWQVVESHTIFQVAYSILDHGVAAMVSFQVQGVALTVGDEGVIAVVGEQRQLGVWRGLYPADDEPHRLGVGLTGKGGIDGLGHIGAALHPVWDRCPVLFRYGVDEIVQLGCWRTVMEKRTFLSRQAATMGWV